MKLTPVQSSQINAIGHSAAAKVLRIEFKNGDLYEYQNITTEIFDALKNAPSIGSHFYKHIKPFKDKFPYAKLENNKADIDAAPPEQTTDELVGDARGVMADARDAEAEANAVVKPAEPEPIPDPVPQPPGG